MIGMKLGTYEVLKKIGQGGMGDIYLGHDTFLDRDVAIKVLPAELSRDRELALRFRREATTFARLNHPNIVQIITAAAEGDLSYLVVEYVPGKNLDELLKTGVKLTPGQKVMIAINIARGLQEIHRHGLVHRDIKPANILISNRGAIKITDFGLAKQLDVTAVTAHNQVLGTPAYMSPEQFQGGSIDHRADIYAFGVLFYELWSGVPPFAGQTMANLAYQHVHEPLPPLPDACPIVSPEIKQLIDKCTAKDPARRFQNMDAVLTLCETLKIQYATVKCVTHADRNATFQCPECRNMFCEECAVTVEGVNYCQECSAGVERCANHPDKRAATVCPRCGKQVCAECQVTALGKMMCGTCAANIHPCFRHPLREASGRCTRCNKYICPDCLEHNDGAEICYDCHGQEQRRRTRLFARVRNLLGLLILAGLLYYIWVNWGEVITAFSKPYIEQARDDIQEEISR